MGACLGVYLGDKVIKYAKLEQEEKTKKISISSYGTKYVVGDKEDVISEIIDQTGSASIPVCLNLVESYKIETEILKQLGKSDIQSVINLEVADFATSKGINEKLVEYRYMLMNSAVSNDNYTTSITIANKADITKYSGKENLKNLSGIYPEEFMLPNLIKNETKYIIVNINEKTSISFITGGKISKIVDIDISMKDILDEIAEQEGSYSKACDICRSINVFTDDVSLSPELERIIEPVIQDLLNRIKSKIDESKVQFEKIYLNGLINLFINVDVLFEQFFSISTEKLKPNFLKQEETTANIAEVIEANDAIALAYEGLFNINKELNFAEHESSKFTLKNFAINKSKDKSSDPAKKVFVMPNINKEKIESALLFANLTAATLFVGYVGFGALYNAEATRAEKKLTEKINLTQLETAKIKEDINYINQNTEQYTKFNNYISETVNKIREGKIGKYNTYNVANFMQRIAKYIPSNVELQSISSNDNKSVTIVAKSTSYAELGYFISQLKLQGILENVKTGNVEHGTYITVTIGGDLP